ncbi:MAG: hypothetical protein RL414_998 [Actinomycetota bacterium]|jgi:sec-independent protein translocase protein TatB
MFGIGAGEFAALIVLALILVGPDRLPHVAADAAKLMKRLKGLANSATEELRENLGPGFEDLQVTDLNPKKFIAKTLATTLDETTDDLREVKKNAQIDPDLL